MYDVFIDWLLPLVVIILPFNIGVIVDGLFLSRERKGTALTPIGWMYIGAIIVFINGFTSLLKSIAKRKVQFEMFIKIPESHKFVSFDKAIFFYLIEISTGILLGLYLTPMVQNALKINTVFIFPFLVMVLSTFFTLFFKALPYAEKRRPFLILSYIILGISFLVTLYLLFFP